MVVIIRSIMNELHLGLEHCELGLRITKICTIVLPHFLSEA